MATADLINELNTDLKNAYSAIEAKGGSVPTAKNSNNLAAAIEGIPAGGGGGDEYEDWGTIYYTNGASTPKIIKLQLTNQADFNALCKSGTGDYSVNNITLLRNRVIGFRFGNKCTTIGDYLLSNCANLEWVTGTENIKTIGTDFLGVCPKLNCDLNLKNVTSIGSSFLTGCEAFAKSITIPSGVTSISSNFMYNCSKLTSLTVETTAHPTDNNSLSTTSSSAPMYTTGITLTGAGAAAWKDGLPDRTSSPYRKLIYVDTSSIEKLQHAIYAGTAETDFPIGTEIPDLWNGAYNPLIVAHYTDIPLTDGTTQKGAYLVRKYADATSTDTAGRPFGSTTYYTSSTVKDYLDTTYPEYCSDNVKEAVSEIKIPYYNGNSMEDIPVKWFLMSAAEVGGMFDNVLEGVFWDYWKQKTGLTAPNNNKNNGRIIRDKNGSAKSVWLRTRLKSDEVASIDREGTVNHGAPNGYAYVLPACAVVGKPTKLQLLKEALNNGTAATEFPIGTEIPDTWDGVDNPLIVAHYGDITLADDTVKNGCYLMRKYATPNTVKFSSNTSSTYQYYNSDLYKYLAGDYLAGCTEEVKNTISQIKIETRKSNGGTLTNRAVKFFAMSYQEVSGSAGSRGEGVQWDLWKQRLGGQVGTNADNAGLMITTPTGAQVSWWLRTLYATNSAYYVHGGADGAYIAVKDTDRNLYVLPACAIVAS